MEKLGIIPNTCNFYWVTAAFKLWTTPFEPDILNPRMVQKRCGRLLKTVLSSFEQVFASTNSNWILNEPFSLGQCSSPYPSWSLCRFWYLMSGKRHRFFFCRIYNLFKNILCEIHSLRMRGMIRVEIEHILYKLDRQYYLHQKGNWSIVYRLWDDN